MGRYLDIVRGHEAPLNEKLTSPDDEYSAEDELSETQYERNELNERIGDRREMSPEEFTVSDLRRGVMRYGVAIAIDRLTGSALLMCSESDCQAVSSVADVYRPPFGIDLTDAQREEIKHDIAFMEAAQRRQKGGRREQGDGL